MEIKDEDQSVAFKNDGFVLVIHVELVPVSGGKELVVFDKLEHFPIECREQMVPQIMIFQQ